MAYRLTTAPYWDMALEGHHLGQGQLFRQCGHTNQKQVFSPATLSITTYTSQRVGQTSASSCPLCWQNSPASRCLLRLCDFPPILKSKSLSRTRGSPSHLPPLYLSIFISSMPDLKLHILAPLRTSQALLGFLSLVCLPLPTRGSGITRMSPSTFPGRVTEMP